MRDFRSLEVWHKAHALVLGIYKATNDFPKTEIYGMTSQLRRAAVPIAANISEGSGRGSGSELKQFLQVAMGSASEVEYELLLSRDLGWLESGVFAHLNNQVCEVKRMLSSYITKIRNS